VDITGRGVGTGRGWFGEWEGRWSSRCDGGGRNRRLTSLERGGRVREVLWRLVGQLSILRSVSSFSTG